MVNKKVYDGQEAGSMMLNKLVHDGYKLADVA